MPLEKLLTEDEVAEALRVSRRHVTNLRDRRLLAFVKLGRAVRFTVPAVENALKQLTVEAKT
ncbi:MAG: helix-turn-helix domain-containing protein [Verrucomicrobiota bacterium]